MKGVFVGILRANHAYMIRESGHDGTDGQG